MVLFACALKTRKDGIFLFSKMVSMRSTKHAILARSVRFLQPRCLPGRRAVLACTGFLSFFGCQSAQAQVMHTRPVSSAEFFIAFCCVVVVTIAAVAFLVDLVRPSSSLSRWQSVWEFSPKILGGFSWRALALWSFVSLFMELMMIRWISSEIRIFAYFKNFVLIACFLGFGLGCYLSRRKANLLLMLVPVTVLTGLVQIPWPALRSMITRLPAFVGASSGTQVWEAPSLVAWPTLLAAIAVVVPIFGLITLFFVPTGQMVGSYIENSSNGTLAYSINVFAALCGIILYTSLCFFSQPPAIWIVCTAILLVSLVWRVPALRFGSAIVFLLCIGLLELPPSGNSRVYWSPYQKLTLSSLNSNGRTLAYSLSTNDTWYQQIIDLSPGFVEAHPDLFKSVPIEWNAYNIPYHFYQQPHSVLILGSGMGNDVAAALRNGAGRVTAVEIDPLILKLGTKFHFEKPYASPLVTVVNDDARSYIENSNNRFDLIVFSLLDSHTTSSYYTNIRIDNYVYTLEALTAAKRLLNPDGIFIVKFQVETPWIAGRLYGLLSEAFENPPIQLEAEAGPKNTYTTGGRFFITGSKQRIARALSDPGLARYVEQRSRIEMEAAKPTTDDWPYFYQRSPGVPLAVFVISTTLILSCVLLLRDMGTPIRSLRWHFFFLGAGFMLLEAQIISKMALLFGTTWLVNSIVIAGLLVLILVANTLVGFKPEFPTTLAYLGLLLMLAVGYLVPVRALFSPSLPARIAASTFILCLPVFFAGIVFMRSFAQVRFSPEALGSNLLGAMVGGMLESASLWTGIRSLALLAVGLYVASWIVLRGVGADQQVATDVSPVGAAFS